MVSQTAKKDDTFRIVGKNLKTLFKNNDTGYTIAMFKIKIQEEAATNFIENGRMTISGYNIPDCTTILYDMKVRGIYNAKYGKQGSLVSIKDYENTEPEAIMRYLTSGPIKGIGKTLAERIYAEFGEETISVINNTPEKLLEIKGIREGKFKKILESKKEHSETSEIMELLLPLGFTPEQCANIYKRYKTLSVDILKNDPFRIVNEVYGISFDRIDGYARKMHLPMNSHSRIQAAIEEALKQNESKGHVAIDNRDILKAIQSVLGSPSIPEMDILKVCYDMRDRKLIRSTKLSGRPLIYREKAYLAEWAVARRSVELSTQTESYPEELLDKYIAETEEKLGITFAEQQRRAAKQAVWNNFMILTGGPGTGKTCTEQLISSVLIKFYADKYKKDIRFCMLSPTGKAAKRMSESTGYPASTVDSRLELRDENESQVMIDEEVTIVDEVSMLDVYKASALLKSVKDGHKVIFVGDKDQLPSVGCGQVLNDLIMGGVPTIKLDRVYRQQGADGEIIVENANRINTGVTTLQYGKGFELFEANEDAQFAEIIQQKYLECVKKYGIDETVCLLPTKKTSVVGVHDINDRIQNTVNPINPLRPEDSIKFFNQRFQVGDIVINTKNDRDKGVVNGDVGVVQKCAISDSLKYVKVKYDNKEVVYKGNSELQMIMLAYSLTIHKSQGSEYKAVIIGLSDSAAQSMMKRNLLYTAVTRAKKEVFLVGSTQAIQKCIVTADTNVRITALPSFMLYCRKHYL